MLNCRLRLTEANPSKGEITKWDRFFTAQKRAVTASPPCPQITSFLLWSFWCLVRLSDICPKQICPKTKYSHITYHNHFWDITKFIRSYVSALSQQHNTNTTNHLHLTQLSILPPTRLLKKSSFTILALHSRSQSFSWTNVEGGPLGWTAWRSFEGPPFDAVGSSGTRWDPPLILFGASGASSGFVSFLSFLLWFLRMSRPIKSSRTKNLRLFLSFVANILLLLFNKSFHLYKDLTFIVNFSRISPL